MPLTLSVVSYKGEAPLKNMSGSFAQTGGVIGRSPDNQFVLPDPDKFVSRKHAIIKYEYGVYSITDTSTSGTSVSNKNVLLQHDTIQLSDGDRLKIGEYEIQVSLSAEEEPSATSSAAFPVVPEPIMPWRDTTADPFGLDAVFAPASAVPRESSPPASFIDQADVAPVHQSLPPLDVAPQQTSDIDVDAILRALESPSVEAGEKGSPSDDWDFAPGLFATDTPEPAASPASTNVAAEGRAQAEPKTRPPVEVSLPAPELGSSASPLAGDAAPFPPVTRTAPGADTRAPQPPAVAKTPAPASSDQSSSASLASSPELFKLFLDGAGIKNAEFANEEEIATSMKTLGVLFRDLVDGMMTVLRARAELKSQFRVSMTTIRPMNNNPLKFTANVEDAMKVLLSTDHPGFVDPVTAVREGLSDLMNHQLAMPAGIQASLEESLKRFDPKRFEQPYQEGIVFQKKAKCWDAYCKAYPSLVNDALESFFGEDFAAAYEQQERILRGRSTNNKA